MGRQGGSEGEKGEAGRERGRERGGRERGRERGGAGRGKEEGERENCNIPQSLGQVILFDIASVLPCRVLALSGRC